VSYLNAKPLIYGLDTHPDVSLELAVPARLLERMQAGQADVALLPVVDLLSMPGLRIVPAGGIGCDGPTLTVRIFSRVPMNAIRTLACDVESHTSVALTRVILAERYRVLPDQVDFRAPPDQADALLLIGDKVVCEEPQGFAYQVDLGAEWKYMTDLPFVFAAWTTASEKDMAALRHILETAKHAGLARIDEIVAMHAVPRGWPAGVAKKYLAEFLRFDVGPRELLAIQTFHQKCDRWGV